MSHNAASNITHSVIADQNSSRVATTFNPPCTVHCTVEDFNVKCCESRSKVGTIPYYTMRMTPCPSVQCPGTVNSAAVQCGDIVCSEAKITRTTVLPGEIMATQKLECHLPMSTPFGPSAGRVFFLFKLK